MIGVLVDAGVSVRHFLFLSAVLFVIGAGGVLINRKSLIHVLLSLELMLLAVNINFAAFSAYGGDVLGQIFVIFVLTVAAAESAVGLAIILAHFRNVGNINIEEVNLMKG